jgi:hypothetical protein
MINGISILFSGGPDSTLAALKAFEEAETVHLLTFHHSRMGKIGKHRKVSSELAKIYGPERVVTHEDEIDALFHRFYNGAMRNRLGRYRTFFIPWICGACKLSMHMAAIRYNRAHGITTTYDGGNAESAPYFVDQMPPYIECMKEFYASLGMRYDCPVYSIPNTDEETEKLGMTSTSRTKKEHVVFSTQHTCFNGLYVHAHARLYYRPFRGKKRAQELGVRMLRELLDDCRAVLEEPS